MQKNKIRLPKLFMFSLLVFAVSSILLWLSKISYNNADALDFYVSRPVRRFMASLGGIVPFSIFEIILLSIPILCVLLIVLFVRAFKRGKGALRLTANVLAIALLLYSGNSIALGIGYNTTPIDERMGISYVEVNEERLAEMMNELCLEVNALSEQIGYEGGTSHFEGDLALVSEKICESFDLFSEKWGFPDSFESRAKGVNALNVLSYLRLTGIYTYYTGEANVNTDYPDYDVVFTAAHELSHQRGILRENEANFMAYLVCSSSDDAYLRYSAALSMLEYVGNALWRTNPNAYYSIMEGLCISARGDIQASSAVTRKYGNTLFADVSEFVNDLFLKSNGTAGVVTYGRVVMLYTSYRYSE